MLRSSIRFVASLLPPNPCVLCPETLLLDQSHPAVIQLQDGNYGVRDELDMEDSTVHFFVRNPMDGKVVAAIRTVDANESQLEMEVRGGRGGGGGGGGGR